MVVKAYVYNRAMLDAVLTDMGKLSDSYGYEMSCVPGIGIGIVDLDKVEYPALVAIAYRGEGQDHTYSKSYAIIREVERCDAGVEQLNANEAVLMIVDNVSDGSLLLGMYFDVLKQYLIDDDAIISVREERGVDGESILILTDTHMYDHQ